MAFFLDCKDAYNWKEACIARGAPYFNPTFPQKFCIRVYGSQLFNPETTCFEFRFNGVLPAPLIEFLFARFGETPLTKVVFWCPEFEADGEYVIPGQFSFLRGAMESLEVGLPSHALVYSMQHADLPHAKTLEITSCGYANVYDEEVRFGAFVLIKKSPLLTTLVLKMRSKYASMLAEIMNGLALMVIDPVDPRPLSDVTIEYSFTCGTRNVKKEECIQRQTPTIRWTITAVRESSH